jgi:biopolymer transport protein ExbD
MGMNVGKSSKYTAEINITPLVDVVLVLLIIFMVIVPLTQLGYDVSIPNESVSAAPPPKADRQVILAVSQASCPMGGPQGPEGLPVTCQVHLNKEPCPASDLARRIGEIFAARTGDDRVLFLAAEESMRYENIVRLLGLAQAGAGGDLAIGIVKDERIAFGPETAAAAPPTGG